MIALALAAASVALPMMDKPDWVRSPTLQDIVSVYPKTAMDERITGQASVECTVSVDGHLRDCRSVQEDPPKYGFGIAAVGLAERLEVRPMQLDGRSVEARVKTTIRFEFPADPPLPSLDEAVDCVARARTTLEQDPHQYGSWNDLTFWTYVMDENAGRLKLRPSDLQARIKAMPIATGGSVDTVAASSRCHGDHLAFQRGLKVFHETGGGVTSASSTQMPASSPAQPLAGSKPGPTPPASPRQ